MDSDFEYVHDWNVDAFVYEDFGAQQVEEQQENLQNGTSSQDQQVEVKQVNLQEKEINQEIEDQNANLQGETSSQKQQIEEQQENLQVEDQNLYVHDWNVDAFVYEDFGAQQVEKQQENLQVGTSSQDQQVEDQNANVQSKPKKEEHQTFVDTRLPPVLDIHTHSSTNVLKTQSDTPTPDYEEVVDEELNNHLNSDFEYVHDWNVDAFGYEDFGAQQVEEQQLNLQGETSSRDQKVEDQNTNLQDETSSRNQLVEKQQENLQNRTSNQDQQVEDQNSYVHDWNVDAFVYEDFESQQVEKQQENLQVGTSSQDQQVEDQNANVQPKPKKKTTQKKKEVHRTPVDARPPPVLDIHAHFSMKVLKTQNITPMPNYKSMMDEELNDHLDKFGMRPMGRKRAIDELTRIYEATHPIIDNSTTPTRERIWSTISECADKPRKKPTVSRKRPAPPEFDQVEAETNKPPTLQELTGEVLRWLRMPQNFELYNECLMMKSIMMDRLIEVFTPLLREKSISKEVFIRILDHLHISYSEPRGESNHYYN